MESSSLSCEIESEMKTQPSQSKPPDLKPGSAMADPPGLLARYSHVWVTKHGLVDGIDHNSPSETGLSDDCLYHDTLAIGTDSGAPRKLTIAGTASQLKASSLLFDMFPG